jgi:ABC-type multidrug transport system fused ATPase/permease subunit
MCKGKTTILATHAVDFFRLADRIVVLDHGSVEAFGTLAELKTNLMMQAILAEHEEQRNATLENAKSQDLHGKIMLTL